MSNHITRTIAHSLSVRSGENAPNSIGTLDGYAAVFNEWTTLYDGKRMVFLEQIAPGAFRDSLARGDDVRALFNHDTGALLGRRSAGTLELAEDEKGLRVSIHLPDTQAGRDTLESVKRGDLTGMSFGFYIRKQSEQREEPKDNGKGYIRTTIEVADLFEVSAVTFPAYPQTELAARSDLTPDQIARFEKADKPAPVGPSARTAWMLHTWKMRTGQW